MIVSTLTTKAQTQLTASESDPIRMGWMQGFPPPPDRTVSMADGSFFEFPALRYSVCNMRLFMPTREVKSAQANRYTFEVCLDPDIDNITFIPLFEKSPITWKQAPCIGDGVVCQYILTELIPFWSMAKIETILTSLYGTKENIKIHTTKEEYMAIA